MDEFSPQDEVTNEAPAPKNKPTFENFLSKNITLLVFVLILLIAGVGSVITYQKFLSDKNQPNSPTPMAQKLPTAKLLFQVFDSGKFGQEKDLYLLDPITKEIVQFTHTPYRFIGLFGKNLVFKIEETNKYYRYDIAKKEYMLLNFLTLKERDDVYEKLYIRSLPTSGDKMLLISLNYNISDKEDKSPDYRPADDEKDYLFSVSQNSFEEARGIEQARRLLEDDITSGAYILKGFDEKNQRAFFQFGGHGIGCSTIAVVDTANNTIQKLYDIEDPQSKSEAPDLGCFYIDPNFDFGFYVEFKIDSRIATLVSLSDISKPLYTFYIKNEADEGWWSSIHSLEWLNDATKMIVSFRRNQIDILDFKNNKLETVYKDSTLSRDYISWRLDSLKSDGETTIAFVDLYDKKYDECRASGATNCPYLINNDYEKIIIQNLFDNSQEIFLDDSKSKIIIGWIDL